MRRHLGLDKVISIPTFESKKSSLYRHRNSSFSVDKTVFDEVKNVKIPPKFEKFVLADYCEGNRRIILFCSEEARNKMTVFKDYFGDGTFKSCPNLLCTSGWPGPMEFNNEIVINPMYPGILIYVTPSFSM